MGFEGGYYGGGGDLVGDAEYAGDEWGWYGARGKRIPCFVCGFGSYTTLVEGFASFLLEWYSYLCFSCVARWSVND